MQNVKDLDLAEIAKLIRRDLKEGIKLDPRLEGVEKFSVKIHRYSQGQSLTVEVVKASVSPFNVRYFAVSEAIENTSWSDFTGCHVRTHIGDAVRAEIKSLPSEDKYTAHWANVCSAVQDVILKYQEVAGEPGDRWYSFYDNFRFASSFHDDAVKAAKDMAILICQEALANLTARSLAPSVHVIEDEQHLAELAEAEQLDDEEIEALRSFNAYTLSDETDMTEAEVEAEADTVSTMGLSTASNLISFPRVNEFSAEELRLDLDEAMKQAEEKIEEQKALLHNLIKAARLKRLQAHLRTIARSIAKYQELLESN